MKVLLGKTICNQLREGKRTMKAAIIRNQRNFVCT